ncbi:flavin monoamine oxidase family protein [Nitriliruptor alkaliphilus]|uniref:flavin monoamine oxidase family protein n=1 Tax=Nitriliruptor alkaliphilus TaxID=427918 RepID=UPI000697A8A8|nr:flavin monoamine oxidase family protein [Nitriliruptor alkaliphilus]
MGNDVVIVGAGVAGLVCAQRLAEAGVGVQVLEARDRVGGRTEHGRLPDGQAIELGGQWIGPGQTRMYALLDELGLTTFPTYDHGEHVLDLGQDRRTYSGDTPPLGGFALADLASSVSRLHRQAQRIDPAAPWTTKHAQHLDARTFETWIARHPTRGARTFWRLLTRAIFATEPANLSLLHVLTYVRQAGSVETLIDTTGGAQQDRVVGGTARIAERLAEGLDPAVRLGAPVRAIHTGDRGVDVELADGDRVRGRRVVVALPPTLAGRIAYHPALPADRDLLTQRVPMGAVIKLHLVYDRPWWREDGLSGQALSDGPVTQVVFDNSPPDGSCGVLLAFIEGADALHWGPRPAEERHAAVAARLAEMIGPAAAHPVAVVERDWTTEPYSRGCYGGHLPPGVWTQLGPALRRPVGRLHWAGTEHATAWTGYLEGAVRSGEETAADVLDALRDG